MKEKIQFLFVLCLLCIVQNVFSQEPNDCTEAVIVCGNSNLSIDVSGIGTQELSGSNTCGSQENNSIWLEVNIETSGTLGFILTPESDNITEDYDFFVFGPNVSCGNIGLAIRCSTTNPQAANQGNNLTGMNATEIDIFEGPGQLGNSFVKELDVLAGERYFFVIDRPIGVSPFSIEWTGTSTFPGNPINPLDTQLLDIEICDNIAPLDDGISEFNLTTLRTDIINGNPGVIVSLHDTESDANINIEPLGDIFNSQSATQTIYARIEDSSSGCFIINPVNLNVMLSPDFNIPSDFMVCDDTNDGDNTNGISVFDFSIKTDEITFGFNASNYLITYHNSASDAENNTMALPLLYSTSTSNPTEIFVRIEELTLGCIGFSSFFIEVLPVPIANNSSIFQCDEVGPQDGITVFNLNQLFDEVTGGTANRTISFFRSRIDAETNSSPLNANAYDNISNPETLTVRVADTNTGCINFSEVTLEVSATAVNDALLMACDDDGIEDGINNFLLSQADAAVLNGLPPGLETMYYATIEDALLENEPLPNDYRNTTPFNQTIFVRVENENDCFGINEVQLEVLDIPDVETEFETLYCLNTFPETITLTNGLINGDSNDFSYEWSTGETTPDIQINAPGIFTVRVFNNLGCFIDRTITVLPSNIAEITNIEVNDATDNNTIIISVTGEGDYEYALDFINGIYQDSNRFENVTPGFHSVFVRDKNNCGISEQVVSVIGFPKFFTPNGDGNNDSWQVQGISSQFQPGTEILIFDRYGKLLKQISPLSSGWDGTFNGNLMPTNDYWFSVTLEDSRQFSSHFTLKR